MNFKPKALTEILATLEMDKSLSQAERDEWQAIYASYQSSSVITGNVIGVDLLERHNKNRRKNKDTQKHRCLIVIKYRVKIIIPETEVFDIDMSTGYHILHSMCGAKISYVITHVDREAGFAIASRKLALEKIRAADSRHIVKKGSILDVQVLSAGRNMCTLNYRSYDIRLPQREISYNVIQDLRDVIEPGQIVKALVKDVDDKTGEPIISVKEAGPHPFEGVEMRHPIKATRIGTIVAKYGGGVFCRLRDGITDVMCSYHSMEYDGDYKVGDTVEIIIRKFNFDKKVVYGKIIRKRNTVK